MKLIKKLSLILFIFLVSIQIVNAKNLSNAFEVNNGNNEDILDSMASKSYNTNQTSIFIIIQLVIKTFLSLLAIIFLLLIIYSGYKYMTAGGNIENTKKALTTTKEAIIGLIIIIGAYAISTFILSMISTNTLK